MSKADYEITTTLFGGYNKKKTESYLESVQNLTNKLQADLDSSEEVRKSQIEKLKEAEGSYKKLWDSSKALEESLQEYTQKLKNQEETLKSQEGTICTQARTIKDFNAIKQKHTVELASRDQAIQKHQENLRIQSDTLASKDQTIQELTEKISSLEEHLAQLTGNLESAAANHSESVEALNQTIANLEGSLSEHETTIEFQKDTLKTLGKTIAAQEETIAEQTETIRTLEQALRQKRGDGESPRKSDATQAAGSSEKEGGNRLEQMLEELLKKDFSVPLEEFEKIMKKQLKKLKLFGKPPKRH